MICRREEQREMNMNLQLERARLISSRRRYMRKRRVELSWVRMLLEMSAPIYRKNEINTETNKNEFFFLSQGTNSVRLSGSDIRSILLNQPYWGGLGLGLSLLLIIINVYSAPEKNKNGVVAYYSLSCIILIICMQCQLSPLTVPWVWTCKDLIKCLNPYYPFSDK